MSELQRLSKRLAVVQETLTLQATLLADCLDENTRFRAGLLRIATRCENWSAADVQANVADLLGMTLAELEAML